MNFIKLVKTLSVYYLLAKLFILASANPLALKTREGA